MVGEELLVELMFSNLIENAIKYSPKYSSIKVYLYSDRQHIIFAVEDEGLGITAEEKNRIFLCGSLRSLRLCGEGFVLLKPDL